MDLKQYAAYFNKEMLMGPNSAVLLQELLEKYPLSLGPDQVILDLGCGKGLTSCILARETGAKVVADDLWIAAEDNTRRFADWGVDGQVTAVHADANQLPFEQGQFDALVSIDAYHYFAGEPGFFEEKLLPFLSDEAVVLIGVPGIRGEYDGRAEQLLSPWLGEEFYMFRSAAAWKQIIGEHPRIRQVETWEMDCFADAWDQWFATGHPYAKGDQDHFETLIRPYTCFVGIVVKLK